MRWLCFYILVAIQIFPAYPVAQTVREFVDVQATDKYSEPGLFETIFFGSNYRKEWGTFVTTPIFDIKNTNFQIKELGGGNQTISLELTDQQNREWALRSVKKDVRPSSKFANNELMKFIIMEQTSGSYPYAGLTVYELASAAGIPSGKQDLYYIPDDSSFGKYRRVMANDLFILVNRQPQKTKGIKTDELMQKLNSSANCYVDSKEYLKARLVDWLVADWDRHSDQWRWAGEKTNSGIVYTVVPRDRDQALYKSNGLLAMIAGFSFMPYINKFNRHASGIKGLSKKAWTLDRQFLSSLNKKEWESAIKEFQKNISDSVIVRSVKKQPPEIFAISGKKMIKKLIARRNGLLKHVMKYYSFLKNYNKD